MPDELAVMRDKQIAEAKALARRMVDIRFDFNDTFTEVDVLHRKYLGDLGRIEATVKTTAKTMRKLQGTKENYIAMRDKYLETIRTKLNASIQEFTEGHQMLEAIQVILRNVIDKLILG
jgi:hypothetical protein